MLAKSSHLEKNQFLGRCFFLFMLFLWISILSGCHHQAKERAVRLKPDEDVIRTTSNAPMPWLHEPASYWQRDFSRSRRDDLVPMPKAELEKEDLGTKTRVHGLFDRWKLNEDICGQRGIHYAEITSDCKGMIELDFAFTQEEWQKPQNRVQYYRAVDALIENIGGTLLADFGNKLQGQEREFFLRALKTLAWQESKWQHYLRHKDWFFVIVSGGSYNKLDDWGITQIARSSFDPAMLLNANFFESKGYCSISSSLYYGFMEYYFCYLEARQNPDNGTSFCNKIVGAYNRYCSGYSSSCFQLAAEDEAYRDYQIRAMGGFKDKFIIQPWEEFMDSEVQSVPPR